MERVGAAYLAALSDEGPRAQIYTDVAVAPPQAANRRGPRHQFPSYSSVNDIADSDLRRILAWIENDGKLRTDDELFEELFQELGFRRRGERITTRLRAAVQQYSTRRPSAVT